MKCGKGRPEHTVKTCPISKRWSLTPTIKVDWLSSQDLYCRAVGLHAPHGTVAQPLQYFRIRSRPAAIARAKPARPKRQKELESQSSRGQKSHSLPKNSPLRKNELAYNTC